MLGSVTMKQNSYPSTGINSHHTVKLFQKELRS